jgi:NADH-quinone oxidoreductase subunit F
VSPIQSGVQYFRDEFLALCQANEATNTAGTGRHELAGAR